MKHEITTTTPINDAAAMFVINAAKNEGGSFERVSRDEDNYFLTFHFDSDNEVDKFQAKVNQK